MFGGVILFIFQIDGQILTMKKVSQKPNNFRQEAQVIVSQKPKSESRPSSNLLSELLSFAPSRPLDPTRQSTSSKVLESFSPSQLIEPLQQTTSSRELTRPQSTLTFSSPPQGKSPQPPTSSDGLRFLPSLRQPSQVDKL